MSQEPIRDFEHLADTEHGGSLVREFWEFLKYNKKWWLLPILAGLLVLTLLGMLLNTAAAPFIYSFF